jgi:alkylated DNA repair dioxygenase AlkB
LNDLFSSQNLSVRCLNVAPDAGATILEAPEIGGIRILLEGGELLFSESFYTKKVSDRMYAYLQENSNLDWTKADWAHMSAEELSSIMFLNVKWKQDHIKFFGKSHPLPRLTSWYGDPGASYAYSGIRSDPNPWSDGLVYVKSKIEDALGTYFNSVLLNWYRDGSDSLSWHADDEKELGPEPIIASATFGESRDFLFRRKGGAKTSLTLKLEHGSLLVMLGKTQQNWVHSVPKRKGVSKSRFNLTFRQILSHSDPVNDALVEV